jgi:DNA topoisomerase VI subunit B
VHQLSRQTFVMSREREFFSEPELTKRIGHARELWPVALVSELVANSLDACEKATAQTGRPPVIEVTLGDDFLTVRDNGPGIPGETIGHAIDYSVRVSDNLFWVSPTRGQLGNALKCVVAAPYVADPSQGWVEFETGGRLHRIDVTLDGISGKPSLGHATQEGGFVKIGTLWRLPACLLPPPETGDSYKGEDDDGGLDQDRSLSWLIKGYATFNPHADFTLVTPGGTQRFEATVPAWSKWTPSEPTDAGWYDTEQFRELVAAHINAERSNGKGLSVREFVAKFRGKKGSIVQCQVVRDAGLDSGTRLGDLARGGNLDADAVERLRQALRLSTTRPVKSKDLGVVGKNHLTRCLAGHYGVVPDSIRYKAVLGKTSGQPFILEVAMGVCDDTDRDREVVAGVNWSPVIKIPFQELLWLLGNASVDTSDPVVVLVHLAVPRPVFTDPGKSQLQLPAEVRQSLYNCVRGVTKVWTEAKRHADKAGRLSERQLERQRRGDDRRKKGELKAASEHFTPAAYDNASGSGRYPARARQIMYANRALVLQSGQPKYFEDLQYFTQTILPNYQRDHPEQTKDWNVVYDARGNLREPHRPKTVPLGTLEVRDYVKNWTGDAVAGVEIDISDKYRVPTIGPANRFKFALFIEKEGFEPLIEAARIRQRFDVAVFSTKGMSVTAARELVEKLSAMGVTILVLTDFDKSGFSICHYLSHDTRRYKFKTTPKVIHVGLRLADVERLGLQSEKVEYDCKKDPRENLRKCGATEEECDFLVREEKPGGGWKGERVELNAMTSPVIVTFIEDKFREHGVEKVVPGRQVLEAAVRRAFVLHRTEQAVETAREEADNLEMPKNLARRVRDRIEGSDAPWDEAVREIAKKIADPDAGDDENPA